MKRKTQILFCLWVAFCLSFQFSSLYALEGEPTCEYLDQGFSQNEWVHVHETSEVSFYRLKNLIENSHRKIVTGYEFGYRSTTGGAFIVNITDAHTNETISNTTIVEPSETYSEHRVIFNSSTDFMFTRGNLTIDIRANDSSAELFLAANDNVVYMDTNARYWNDPEGDWEDEDKLEYYLAPILESIPSLPIGEVVESRFANDLYGYIDAFYLDTRTLDDPRELRFVFHKTSEIYSGIARLDLYVYRNHSVLSDLVSIDSQVIPDFRVHDSLVFDQAGREKRPYLLVLRSINDTHMNFNFSANFVGQLAEDTGDPSFLQTPLGQGIVGGAVVIVIGGILLYKYRDTI